MNNNSFMDTFTITTAERLNKKYRYRTTTPWLLIIREYRFYDGLSPPGTHIGSTPRQARGTQNSCFYSAQCLLLRAGVREFRVRGPEWGVGVIESWSVECDGDHS
jgi:hypothetical protein